VLLVTEGEQIECEGLILRAERVARRRIGRVRIGHLGPERQTRAERAAQMSPSEQRTSP
jgi:hypothetical protein